jgi:HD-GYP domain-containing protein (c-di-GMP phosphodiesterase class II)
VSASELILSRGLAPSFLGHATDTCALAAVTAARFGWDESVLFDVALAALLADIGMLTVPDEVVGKPGRLTAAERRAVEAHTTTAAAILEPFREVAPLVPLVAAQHHEQVDGGGYPEGRSGEGVRPEMQVVAIAHRYLAMVTERGYRAAVEPHWALHGLDELSGTVVSDPVVRAFTAAVAPYPSGAYLTLVDGRAGRVVGTRGRALELELMFDALGEPHQPAVERIEPNRIRSFCDAMGA